MQYDHHGTRIDNGASVDSAELNRARDDLYQHFWPGDDYAVVSDNYAGVSNDDIAAACHDYLAAYHHATGDSWHAADELAYTHDRATHLGKRPG